MRKSVRGSREFQRGDSYKNNQLGESGGERPQWASGGCATPPLAGGCLLALEQFAMVEVFNLVASPGVMVI